MSAKQDQVRTCVNLKDVTNTSSENWQIKQKLSTVIKSLEQCNINGTYSTLKCAQSPSACLYISVLALMQFIETGVLDDSSMANIIVTLAPRLVDALGTDYEYTELFEGVGTDGINSGILGKLWGNSWGEYMSDSFEQKGGNLLSENIGDELFQCMKDHERNVAVSESTLSYLLCHTLFSRSSVEFKSLITFLQFATFRNITSLLSRYLTRMTASNIASLRRYPLQNITMGDTVSLPTTMTRSRMLLGFTHTRDLVKIVRFSSSWGICLTQKFHS